VEAPLFELPAPVLPEGAEPVLDPAPVLLDGAHLVRVIPCMMPRRGCVDLARAQADAERV